MHVPLWLPHRTSHIWTWEGKVGRSYLLLGQSGLRLVDPNSKHCYLWWGTLKSWVPLYQVWGLHVNWEYKSCSKCFKKIPFPNKCAYFISDLLWSSLNLPKYRGSVGSWDIFRPLAFLEKAASLEARIPKKAEKYSLVRNAPFLDNMSRNTGWPL